MLEIEKDIEWYFDMDLLVLKKPTKTNFLFKKILGGEIINTEILRVIDIIGNEKNIYCVGFGYDEYQKEILTEKIPVIEIYWYDNDTDTKNRSQVRNLIDFRQSAEIFITTEERCKWLNKGFNYIGVADLKNRIKNDTLFE